MEEHRTFKAGWQYYAGGGRETEILFGVAIIMVVIASPCSS